MKIAQETKSLVQRLRENPKVAARIDREKAALLLELQFERELERRNETPAELARRIGSHRSTLSRDLSGALSRANLQRVSVMAAALDCDLVTVVLPREPKARKQKLDEVTRLLA